MPNHASPRLSSSLVALLAITLVGTAAAGPSGRGTGGIPAVLAELEQLRSELESNRAALARIEANQAALPRIEANQAALPRLEANQADLLLRLASLEAELSLVGEDVLATLDEVTPCTPERWRAGECNVLEVEASVCFTLALGSEIGASFGLEPGIDVVAGAGWPNGLDVELAAEAGLPFVLSVPVGPYLPPALVVLPDLEAGTSASAEGTMEICIANLSLPAGSASADDFVRELVSALESRGAEVVNVATEIASERGLGPNRFGDALNAMSGLAGGGIEVVQDPLEVFQDGPLADLASTLPVADELVDAFANPHQALPNTEDPFAICDLLAEHPDFMGELGDSFEAICVTVGEQPDLAALTNAIDAMPEDVADKICDLIPELCTDSSLMTRRECRRSCRQTARACKLDCGVFDFPCRRECEATKDDCIDGCR